VRYLDGPFQSLNNVWHFTPQSGGGSTVDFAIAYAFRSRTFQAVAGAVFDRAFQRFAEAFEMRADRVYGRAA
jgi:coenzyme Q-binding protein COQ10